MVEKNQRRWDGSLGSGDWGKLDWKGTILDVDLMLIELHKFEPFTYAQLLFIYLFIYLLFARNHNETITWRKHEAGQWD